MGLWTNIRQFDAYPKTLEDFRIKTFSGAFGRAVPHTQTNKIIHTGKKKKNGRKLNKKK